MLVSFTAQYDFLLSVPRYSDTKMPSVKSWEGILNLITRQHRVCSFNAAMI